MFQFPVCYGAVLTVYIYGLSPRCRIIGVPYRDVFSSVSQGTVNILHSLRLCGVHYMGHTAVYKNRTCCVILKYLMCLGTAVSQWLRYCAINQKVSGSIPGGVNGIFHWHKSFWSHYGPGVDSASNRNVYREYLLGGECGRCVRLTSLPPFCAVVKKSGNLNSWNPLGHPRPVTGRLYLLFDVSTRWWWSF
jgi:hypothetical protein